MFRPQKLPKRGKLFIQRFFMLHLSFQDLFTQDDLRCFARKNFLRGGNCLFSVFLCCKFFLKKIYKQKIAHHTMFQSCDIPHVCFLLWRVRGRASAIAHLSFQDLYTQDDLNLSFSCSLDIESTSHFLLHCLIFNDEKNILLSTLNKTDCNLLELTNSFLSQTLLCEIALFDKENKPAHS